MDKKWICITPGDPRGIGPEVVALARKKIPQMDRASILFGCPRAIEAAGIRPLLVDELASSEHLALVLKKKKSNEWITVAPPSPSFRKLDAKALAGFQSGYSIESAVRWIHRGLGSALVTGPISKDALQAGGYLFPGHTEFLSSLCENAPVTMMMANRLVRVSLVTIHEPLSRVSRLISKKAVEQTLTHTESFLRLQLGIKRPKIVVLGLNPHAGEGGVLGNEEEEIILPVIRSLQKKWRLRCDVLGPVAADGFFGTAFSKPNPLKPTCDAVVAMYHDQGLIPAKLLDWKNTVNLTLGLPIVRTSVDHGTAFDLVGKGLADPSSFISAFRMAQFLDKKRKHLN